MHGVLISEGCQWSCSRPRREILPSGHQRYPLKGLNLGYMYWGQIHSSEKIENIPIHAEGSVVCIDMFFLGFKGKK